MFAIIYLVLTYSVGGSPSPQEFIAIISLCITCFALGYAVGSKSNDKK